MTKFFLLFALILLPSLAEASTWPAPCTTAAAVQAVHDNPSTVNGDTITIATGQCHWATTVAITKAITIKGASACTLQSVTRGSLTIQIPTSCPTNILADTNSPLIDLTLVSNQTSTIAELQFSKGTATNNGGSGNGTGQNPLLYLKGGPHNPTTDSRRLRMYHVFTNVWHVALWTEDILGVIDHNNFITVNHSFHNNRNWNNSPSDHCYTADGPLGCWGDLSYADSSRFGTEYSLFKEDNLYQCVAGSGGGTDNTFDDGQAGMRLVVRYSIGINCTVGGHGTESGGRVRSMRVMEVYNNIWDFSAGVNSNSIGYRGGTGVIFNNTHLGNSATTIALNYDRLLVAFKPFGCGVSGPTNTWDLYPASGNPFFTGTANGASAGTTVAVTGVNWTTNQWVGYSVKNTTMAVNSPTGPGTPCRDTATGTHSNFGMITGNTPTTITYHDSGGFSGNLIFNSGDGVQIFKALKGLDQPGRVMGTPVPNNVSNYDTPTIPWTTNDQVQDPIYCWNNLTASSTVIPCASTAYTIVLGEDFVNGVKPGYTSYVYPHPLVSGIGDFVPPAAPTGVTIQ